LYSSYLKVSGEDRISRMFRKEAASVSSTYSPPLFSAKVRFFCR
jgi:hypothetical protein